MAEDKLGKPDLTEIASVSRDPWNPAAKLKFLLPLDDTLITRGGGQNYRIYDEIERDARAYAVVQKRKMALLAYPWRLIPASEAGPDVAAAELVEAQLHACNFSQAVWGLQDAILKGFAVGECMWESVGGAAILTEIRARDQRRFTFDHDSNLRMRDWSNMYDGVAVPLNKMIVHSVGSKDWSPFGLGLGTRLFWLVFFKRQDITFWLTFLDKFGSPTAVGRYPGGTPPGDQQRLLDALFTIAQDSGVIIPSNMQIDLLEAQRSGSIDAYERCARYLDEEIAVCALGETLSTSLGDVGSQAAAGIHNDVRLELVQSDGELMAATLNRSVVRWITEFNIAGATPPRLRFDVSQTEDLGARANRDQIISQMGFQPTLKYITDTYGGEWVERPPTLPADGADSFPSSAFAEVKPNAAAKTAAEINRFGDQAGRDADPVTSDAVASVRALLDKAESLEEFRDGLAGLAARFDAATFAKIIEQATMTADLAGRLGVLSLKSGGEAAGRFQIGTGS
jgi:phage gp29-like protein